MRLRGLFGLTVLLAIGIAPAAVPAAVTQLRGTTGPGFTITLQNGDGALVSKLDPGTYEIVVRDLSPDHNFHLFGPGGVEEFTGVDTIETVTWTVTLGDGRYTYLCDLHPSQMVRELVVGTPPVTTPPPAPAPAPLPKLLATVGPKNTISLRSASGALLRRVKPRTYSIVVRDRSKLHNFHLVGTGVNRKTGRAATGTFTWKVKLAKGTLRFFSDRSPKTVKGSVLVG